MYRDACLGRHWASFRGRGGEEGAGATVRNISWGQGVPLHTQWHPLLLNQKFSAVTLLLPHPPPPHCLQCPCASDGQVPPRCAHPGAHQEPGGGQCLQHYPCGCHVGAGGAGGGAGAQRPRATGEHLLSRTLQMNCRASDEGSLARNGSSVGRAGAATSYACKL